MMNRSDLVRLAVALTGAAVFAQGAVASGEPKNEAPFTRQVARTVAAASHGTTVDVHGESKNQLPFTRRVAR